MKNSIVSLICSMLYTMILFICTLVMMWGKEKIITILNIDSLFVKYIFIFVLIFIYILIGFFLDCTRNKRYDFLYGWIMILISVLLWIFTMNITKESMWQFKYEYGEYWILFCMTILPVKFIFNLINVNGTPFIFLILSIIPSLLIGVGIKIKRFIKLSNNK